MAHQNLQQTTQTPHSYHWRPWRPIAVPILLTILFLTAGVPLFLRTPLWCDITLYDLAARAVLTGGVHYRDVFDTNLPGYVWLLAVIRGTVGWSSEALRAVDLVVVVATLVLLDRFARRGGASRWARWWVAAGAAAFYPFTTEFVHAQRDVWLALPAVLAVYLRVRRAAADGDGTLRGGAFVAGFTEGVCWALAVWIKPHVVTVAAPVWLLTARRLACRHERPWRALAADLLGNVAGGGLVGALGVLQLVTSGTWPHFWTVMTEWNPAYSKKAFLELADRAQRQLYWFPPWSWFLPLSALLAALAVLDARPWSGRFRDGEVSPGGWVLRNLVTVLLMAVLFPYRLAVLFAIDPLAPFVPAWVWAFGRWTARTFLDATGSDRARYVRGGLGALYLAWVAQAFVLQRGFHYVHVTEVFLMLALWAAHRWCLPALVLAWVAVTSAVVLFAGEPSKPGEPGTRLADAVERFEVDVVGRRDWYNYYFVLHPVLERDRMRWWAACFRPDLTAAERLARTDGLRHMGDFEASPNWTQLHEVAEFLRARGVGDRQFIAWHDSTHPLYLILGVKPGLRFMHVNTAASIDPARSPADVMREANANVLARYVVADIESMGYFAEESYGLAGAKAAWSQLPTDLRSPPLPPHPVRVATIRDAEVTDFEFPFDRDPRLPAAGTVEAAAGGWAATGPLGYPFDRRPVLFRSKGGTGRYIVFELCQPIRGVFERP